MDVDGDEGFINMDVDFVDEEFFKKFKKKDKKKKKDKNKEYFFFFLFEDEENQFFIFEKVYVFKEVVDFYNVFVYEDIIQDMLICFKYILLVFVFFGFMFVEILLVIDDEFNKLVIMKGIVLYKKGGIGIQGKGLGKWVRELKDKL